ncbi:MAG TPA: cupredoxin domain-containing protein [Actinomycetota bacterium]|nr:cupredoxin domain-containing protein [Actinomycetota bacterium]
MVRTRRLVALVAAVASLVLVAPAHAGIGQFIEVDEYGYDPDADTIAQPTQTYFLVFDNVGGTTHSAVSDGGMFDTEAIAPGDSSQIAMQGAGTYPYHCAFHPARMRGVFRLRPVASATTVGVGDTISLQIAPDLIKTPYVYDVQRRRGDGGWKVVRHGIGDSAPTFTFTRTGEFTFRARSRVAFTEIRSGWSPPRKVSVLAG